MRLYQVTIYGIRVQSEGSVIPNSPACLYLAKHDSDAIDKATRISSGIGVPHSIEICEHNGQKPLRTVINRECEPGEAW